MYYEINVSYKGVHFFATAERSITDECGLVIVLNEIVKRFPESDGYEVSAGMRQSTGLPIDVAETVKHAKLHYAK